MQNNAPKEITLAHRYGGRSVGGFDMNAKFHRFTITYFTNEFVKSLRTQQVTLPELREQILRTTADKKSRLPWFKGAVFGTKRTKLGSLRHNDNVTAISGIEADYDGEEISIELGATLLRRARLRSLLYTSPSFT
jgi:hypothetical protein